MKVLHSSPGLEDLWQLHFSLLSGQEYTVPGMFIANTVDEPPAAMPIAAITAPAPGAGAAPPPVHNGTAYWIKISASEDGSFTVTNAAEQLQQDVREALGRTGGKGRMGGFFTECGAFFGRRSPIFRCPRTRACDRNRGASTTLLLLGILPGHPSALLTGLVFLSQAAVTLILIPIGG